MSDDFVQKTLQVLRHSNVTELIQCSCLPAVRVKLPTARLADVIPIVLPEYQLCSLVFEGCPSFVTARVRADNAAQFAASDVQHVGAVARAEDLG